MRDAKLQRRARSLRNQATDAEQHLWRHLRRRQLNGYRFRRQVPISNFIADFACLEAKLVIELDGGHHSEQAAYDRKRDDRLAKIGYRVLRFWDDQVFRETDAVLEVIVRALESNAPILAFPRKRGKENVKTDRSTNEEKEDARMDVPPQASEGNSEGQRPSARPNP